MNLFIIKDSDVIESKYIHNNFTLKVKSLKSIKQVSWDDILCDFLNQKPMTKKETIAYFKNYLTLNQTS
jgi:hypothetical protein